MNDYLRLALALGGFLILTSVLGGVGFAIGLAAVVFVVVKALAR